MNNYLEHSPKILSNTYVDTRDKIRKHRYIIGIKGKGSGTPRKGNKEFSIKDIKRVSFLIGEEKEAIRLFVDTNKEILLSNRKFRFKSSFYPQSLYRSYIKYLYEGELEDVPEVHGYQIARFAEYSEEKQEFCEYIRKRCKTLLKDPQSLLHNCDLLNDLAKNGKRKKIGDKK